MSERFFRKLQGSLSRKITIWVMVILLILIVFIISGAQWITKNFYQEHLITEIDERIAAHAMLLETNQDKETFDYLNQLEIGKHGHLYIVDEELNPLFYSKNVSEEQVADYERYIIENYLLSLQSDRPLIVEMDTSVAFHIPHIWGLTAITDNDGQAIGYILIDQDTGELNVARGNLLILMVAMGVLTIIIGYGFTVYLSRRISNPLNEISRRTKDIAAGDFDIELQFDGNDEVAMLGNNIQKMTRQLKEYRDSRRQFITHISHDLRTPITYIKGYSALMKDSCQAQNGWKRNSEVIYQEAVRMEKLVSDLFLLTKLQEGKIQLHCEHVNIKEWVESLFQSRALMFDQKQIDGSLIFKGISDSQSVYVDPFRMEQAIINILENAIRYTNKQGSIDMTCVMEKSRLVMTIEDTGEGMDQEDLAHIWERFYKADPARSRSDSGTGLGLAIVKEIVEAHQGFVEVRSEKEIGTTFILSIPVSSKNHELENKLNE